MKKRIAVVSFWAILIVCTVLWAYQKGLSTKGATDKPTLPTTEMEEERPEGMPEGIGTPEDRLARFNYERMRLVNPATGEIPKNIRQKELAFANSKAFKSGSTNTTWDHRGPYNVGGRTRALAFDVDNANTIIAGGVTGGMWRSTDGGQSFTKTTRPDQLHSVTCVAQDKRAGKHNVWYHGTGEYYAVIAASSVDGSGNGIYKSTDNGQSWELLQSTTSGTPTTGPTNGDFDFVWDIVVDHTDNSKDVLFAAVINGIYKSEDGGTTWALSLGDTASGLSEYTTVQITDNGVLYAAFGSGSNTAGVWRSADQGANWTEITPNGWPSNASRPIIGLNPLADKLYVVLNTSYYVNQLWHYTYVSGSGNATGGYWQNLTSNLPARDCEVFYDFNFGPYHTQGGYDMAIAISPTDTNVVILGGTNVYRSTNAWRLPDNYDWIGGYQCDSVTPSNYIYPDHHPDQHKFLFHPTMANVLYTANDGGIYKTDNVLQSTVTWTPLDNGYMNSQFYTVAVQPGITNSNHIVGGMQDNGTYFTNSLTATRDWKSVFYGDGAYCAITKDRANYYLSWQGGKTFKFEIDDNGNIDSLTRIDPQGASGYLFINPFILDPDDNNTMYLAGGRYIWRNDSLDIIPLDNEEYAPGTIGWTRLDASLTGLSTFSGTVSALDMSKSDNTTLFYGTNNGKLFKLDDLNTASPVRTTLSHTDFPANAYIASIDLNENDPNEVLVSFSNYGVLSLFHSNDAGASWENISGDLEENPDGSGNGPAVLWAEMIDLVDSTLYFAGTSTGLYSTSQLNGNSTIWRAEGSPNIGNVVVNMIQTRSFDGLVVVGTHGNGVYSTRFKDYVSTGPELNASNALSLNCTPNPFKNKVAINFELDDTKYVMVTVIDLSGKTITELVNTKLNRGKQTLYWNGTDKNGNQAPTGAYIVNIQAGNTSNSQQIIYTP